MTSAINFEKFRTKPRPKLNGRHKQAEEAYAQLHLKTLARACAAVKHYGIFVWAWINFEAWNTESQTVKVTNKALKVYGVSRYAKNRAIAGFERAGLITTTRQGKEAITVTLTTPLVHVRRSTNAG